MGIIKDLLFLLLLLLKTVVQSSNIVVQASGNVEETPGLNASSGD